MPFYRNYLQTDYTFGKETYTVKFPNLVAYSDIWEEVKREGSFYRNFYIKDGVRPDNAAQQLYSNPLYDWVFFYVNDHLRESGWPLDNIQLASKVARDFPNTTLTVRDDIFDNFRVGSTVTGQTSNVSGIIIKRNVNLGQLVVEGTLAFVNGEGLETTEDETIKVATVESSIDESLSVHHYSDSSGIVDIDPNLGPGVELTAVSYKEFYETLNEELRTIRVLRPEIMSQVIQEFKRVMK